MAGEPADDPLVKHLQEIEHQNAEIERLQLELVKQAHLHREELEHKHAEMERLRYDLQHAQSRMRPLQDDEEEVKRLTAELETLKGKHAEELKRSVERWQRESEQRDHAQREALRQKEAELERVRALLLDSQSFEGSPNREHAHCEALQRETLRLRDDAMQRQLEKESLAARIQEMERSHQRQVDQFLAALESDANQRRKLGSFLFQQNANAQRLEASLLQQSRVQTFACERLTAEVKRLRHEHSRELSKLSERVASEMERVQAEYSRWIKEACDRVALEMKLERLDPKRPTSPFPVMDG